MSTPLSAVLRDDLLLDAVGARQETDDEIGALLLAVARRADRPIPRPHASRRIGRHRGLTVLAALGVAVSGATVAAAVELGPTAPDQAYGRPHVRTFLPPSLQALVMPFLSGSPFQGRLVLPLRVAGSEASSTTGWPLPLVSIGGGLGATAGSAASAGQVSAAQEAQADRQEQQDQQDQPDASRATVQATGVPAGPDAGSSATGLTVDGNQLSGDSQGGPDSQQTTAGGQGADGQGGSSAAPPPSVPTKPANSEATPATSQAGHGTVAPASSGSPGSGGSGVKNGQANGIVNGNGQAKGRGATGAPTGSATSGGGTSGSGSPTGGSGSGATAGGDDQNGSGAPAKGQAKGQAKGTTKGATPAGGATGGSGGAGGSGGGAAKKAGSG